MAVGTITNTNFFTASIRTGASDGVILLNGADATVNTNRRIAMLNLGVNGASTLYYNPTTGAQDIIITNESGQATIFNQNNEDVDFRIDGTGVDNIFRVDAANDRIGIGTALPSEKLDVVGNIKLVSSAGNPYKFNGSGVELTGWFTDYTDNGVDNSNNPTIYSALGSGSYPFNQSGNLIIAGRNNTTLGGKILLYTNDGANRVETLHASFGNVGIGDFSSAPPNVRLHVKGDDVRMDGTSINNLFYLDHSADNIGIGTALPSAKLHVIDNAVTNANGIRVDGSFGSVLGTAGTTVQQTHISKRGVQIIGAALPSASYEVNQGMVISTNVPTPVLTLNNTLGNTALAIENGRVGIGTALPSAKLHVNSGNIRVDSDLALVGTPMLRLLNSTSNAGLQVHADGNVYTNAPQFSGFATQVGGTNVWQVTTNSATSAKIRLPSAVFTWNRAGDDFFMFGHDGSSNSWAFQDAAGTFTAPDASSLLSLNSSTKGFLPPRMTTTERNAISSPAEGLVIYNETTQVLNFYNGTTWGAV